MESQVAFEESFSALQHFAKKFTALSEELYATVKCKSSDHLGTVAVPFLRRQIDHLDSAFAIAPRRDTILIARTQFEGLCRLSWIELDPGERALRWRAFSYVHDWRQIRKARKRGEIISKDEEHRVNEGLSKFADVLHSKKALKAIENDKNLPEDPYIQSAAGEVTIREICDEVGAEFAYRSFYNQSSDWQHWGTGGVGSIFDMGGNTVMAKPYCFRSALGSLKLGIHALASTASIVNKHFDLGRTEELSGLVHDFEAWLDGQS